MILVVCLFIINCILFVVVFFAPLQATIFIIVDFAKAKLLKNVVMRKGAGALFAAFLFFQYLCTNVRQHGFCLLRKPRIKMMKHFSLIFVLLCLCVAAEAQISRRTMERLAADAVNQIVMTGYMPSAEVMGQLASVADVSVDMISRMGDADDAGQARACLKLIDAIADFTQKPEGMLYADAMREGLKKAIDRSDDPEVRRHLLDGLATCATAADVPHLVMYLQDADMAPVAFRALVSMAGIDSQLAELVQEQTPADPLLKNVIDARAGKTVSAPMAKPVEKKAELPMWTASLDRLVDRMRTQPDASADSLLRGDVSVATMKALLKVAARRSGTERDGIIARFLALAERLSLTGGERYLLLREADALNPCDDLRRKIIIDLGTTHSVQALAYIRKYYDSRTMGDAVAVAVADIMGHNPRANGGKHVYNMLNAAKYALACHYGEQGIGEAIDNVLDAMQDCRLDCGYDLSASSVTRMGKNGFWKLYDEISDFDMAFDWKAEGELVVTLRSMPVLTLDCRKGARLVGDSNWHEFGNVADWATANIRVHDNKVSVCVNGKHLFSDMELVNPQSGADTNASGVVMFNADAAGAEMRQVCIKKMK